MRRILGAIGATLAIVVLMVTTAAPASALLVEVPRWSDIELKRGIEQDKDA